MTEDPLQRIEREERERREKKGPRTLMTVLAIVAGVLALVLGYLLYQRNGLVNQLEGEKQDLAQQMVALQSDPDMVLEEIREYQGIVADLEGLPSDAEKHRYCIDRMDHMTSCFTATVSYVGNADMGDAEYYIQEFHALPSTALPASATPLTLELSAMNGSFYVNFMQFFEGELYLNAFIQELRDNDINYDVLYQEENKYPRMIDLWSGR